jgi:hypothetical protein
MFRSQLEPHLNTVVYVSTIPVGKKKHDYFLHKTVQVLTLQRNETTIDVTNILARDISYNYYALDHIWISPTVINNGNCLNCFTKLFDRLFPGDRLYFLAKIEKYIRNDGTTDYGFAPVSKLEKFVYQLLIPQYFLHYKFCTIEPFGKVYDFYRKRLTNSPLPIEQLFEKYREYAVKLLREIKQYQKDLEELVEIQDNNKFFSTQFEQDKYCAFAIVDVVLTRVNNICIHMNNWCAKNEKRLLKKERKQKARSKIKSRAKGFGITNV